MSYGNASGTTLARPQLQGNRFKIRGELAVVAQRAEVGEKASQESYLLEELRCHSLP